MILSTLPLIAQFVFENACIIAEYMADNLRLNTWESYMKEAILMKESNRVFILLYENVSLILDHNSQIIKIGVFAFSTFNYLHS